MAAVTFLTSLQHQQLVEMCENYMSRVSLLLDDDDSFLIEPPTADLLDLLFLVSELNYDLYQLKCLQFKNKSAGLPYIALRIGLILENLENKEEELKKQNIYLELQ